MKKFLVSLAAVGALLLPLGSSAQADEIDVSQRVGSCTLTVVRVTYDPSTGSIQSLDVVEYVCT